MKEFKINTRLLVLGIAGVGVCLFFASGVFAAKMDRILPSPIPGAEYVGKDSCVSCHAQQGKEFENSTHAKYTFSETEAAGQGCEICHGPGSKHVEAGGKGFIVNPRKNPGTCFECHPEKKAEFSLQFRHPVLEGKMSCADCHSPHSEEVLPGSAVTLENTNEKCLKCHPEYRGPFAYEHDSMREGCTVCHTPHGSINDKMLLAGDDNICMKCHYEKAFPAIGDSNHGSSSPAGPANVARGNKNCFKCHLAVHGSNFSPYFFNE
jgi:predicted CXXCH cytochrome family protein